MDAALSVEVQCPSHAEAWCAKARFRAVGEVLSSGAERTSKPDSWKSCSSKADAFLPIGADLFGVSSIKFVSLLVAELLAKLIEM